jgi:hypothetical protein
MACIDIALKCVFHIIINLLDFFELVINREIMFKGALRRQKSQTTYIYDCREYGSLLHLSTACYVKNITIFVHIIWSMH